MFLPVAVRVSNTRVLKLPNCDVSWLLYCSNTKRVCSGTIGQPLATDTEVNSCFSIYKNSEIIQYKNMILPHLFLQRLQHFRAQIPREWLGGE